MNELKRRIEPNELQQITWHEWIKINDLKGMYCQKCSDPLRFLRFSCEIELLLLLHSRAHFADLISQQWYGPGNCFTILMWNRALATVSCRFCRPLSGSRRAPAETETLQRRPRTGTLPKKHRVLRPRIFSAVNSRFPDRSHFPTTSWCDWHDGETASHWQSSVTRKFPN